MALATVAIVGRPNVGKSSLLNRLARQRVSIVSPTPGVTRDRVSTLIELPPPVESPSGTPAKLVQFVDTGGYGAYTAQGRRYDDVGADLATLAPEIEAQIAAAVGQAQLVLLLVDAQQGLTALDLTIAAMLRRMGARAVLPVANKVDSDKWLADAQETARLGFGEPVAISAASGLGVGDLLDRIWTLVSAGSDPAPPEEMRLAIVGKRNAGKSTLINTLAGEPRVIVSEIAGTTRDAVDVRFEIEGRTMLAIDTAGVRKRKSVADDVEMYAYDRMLSAMARADVAMFLIDATADVSQVDKKLADELLQRFKPTVIAVNKWDLVKGRATPADYQDYLSRQLRGLEYAPIVFMSATRGTGVRDAVAMAFNLNQQAAFRETTGRLNRIVESIIARRGPSGRLGTEARVFYASQIGTKPPTIVLVVNDPKLFRGSYERYLLNRLHEELGCSEVPIRLFFRKRRRASLEGLAV